jgi:hypothetical protein
MTYHTLQRLSPSGDSYLLRWLGDQITQYLGPMHYSEEDELIESHVNPNDLDLDDDPDMLDTLNHANWGMPYYEHRQLVDLFDEETGNLIGTYKRWKERKDEPADD